MSKTVEYYLSLPYTIELVPEPQEGWFVSVKELPGCMSQGDTPEEAIEMIQDAMRGWIEVSLEDGDPIPEPRSIEDYSGRFVVRVPRSLHRELVECAEREGVSLNQYINVALARSVGRESPASPATVEESEWPGLKAKEVVIQQRGEPAAVVMDYEDHQALMTLPEDLEDIRDVLESEGEPTRPLSAYLAERGKPSASV